jgi:hypothetical protein
MTNHIHLALQAGDMPLSRGMQNLSFRYTRWINWRAKRTGHLFQGRYKAVLVDSDSYLLELVRYIHLNPVRVGMVKTPGAYPWCSHQAYLGKEQLPWLTTDWLLEQFGTTVKVARAGYTAFVSDGLGEEHRPEFHGGSLDPRVLGDDNFVDSCLASSGNVPPRVTIQEIVAKVCQEYNIEMAALQTQSQQRTVSEARAVVGWLARETGCVTLSEVGTIFNRDVGTISSTVSRLSTKMQNLPELTSKLQSLKSEILKVTCHLGSLTP